MLRYRNKEDCGRKSLVQGRSAQAVSEFIFTYGWVLLGVLAIFGAMYYMGVGRADFISTEECVLYSGIRCLDFTYNGTHLEILLENELGFGIMNMNISINGTCSSYLDVTMETEGSPASLSSGASGAYSLPCVLTQGINEENIRVDFTISKTDTNHTKRGRLRTTIQ